MPSMMLPKKGTSIVIVKPKMDKPKITSDPIVKDESRSFLSFSRDENLSVSHSDIEQGFNKTRPRIRRETILSLIAIFLALFCIGLEIWNVQTVVDNAKAIELLKNDIESMKHRLLEEDLVDEMKAFEEVRIMDNAKEIEKLKHDIETMKHRLIDEDLLDEMKAFEEMYAKEDSEDDDDAGDPDDDNEDYDTVYEYDDEEDDQDEDSKFSNPEYLGDHHSAPYSTDTSESSNGSVPVTREDDLNKVLAALKMAELKGVRETRRKLERERVHDKEELSDEKQRENFEGEDEDEPITEDITKDSDTSRIKRKRSAEKEQPVGYNPSGVPIYAHGYLHRKKKNSTRNLAVPKLSLYESMVNGEKATTEKSKEESLVHHAVMFSWDKPPPKKYYAQSRAATSHVTPPPLYASRVHNPRQINGRRSGNWRNEGPQALTRRDDTGNRQDRGNSKPIQDPRPQRRRGMTRRHLRGTRQIVAAHYGADSSLFAAEDEHVGNGKGRHHEGVFKAWRASNWMGDLGMSRHFTLSTDGQLTVQETGLYLIYAQIHYVDQHDENGFQVLVNNTSILQCMVYSPGSEHKSRSCFSAQATFLQSGDRLVLRDVGMDRYSLFQRDKSFFGLVKFGDTRAPRQQQ